MIVCLAGRGSLSQQKKLDVALSLAGGESRVNICLAGEIGRAHV